MTNSEGRLVQIPVAHEIRERTAAEAFSYNILDVSNTGQGQNPQVTFSVTDPTNSDAPYDIHADESFTVCAGGVSRLGVNIAWSTTDYANIGSGRLPALPLTINPLAACGGASTNNGDGTFTVTSATAIPATATGSLSVAVEGHPAVDVYNDGSYEAIAVTNAIVYARDLQTVGIGAGQMSRVVSAKIAGLKAEEAGLVVPGSVMASDAFFPFRDGIDAAAKAGIAAVIQPGGSMRDAEVIAAADEHGMAMVFTGRRHFRH